MMPEISIHALLAESDRQNPGKHYVAFRFLSTLSLRRATRNVANSQSQKHISIHALLAESDKRHPGYCAFIHYFYPRSPCGERPLESAIVDGDGNDFYPRSPCGERLGFSWAFGVSDKISIHALLAESDGNSRRSYLCRTDFYPRSPCGERQTHQ